MAGKGMRTPPGVTVVGVVALLVVAYTVLRPEPDDNPSVPPEAAGWYGAMSLYRKVALWAGRRAMDAELHYWKAVN